MFNDTRWAARYQFLEDLWRGRDRLLLDPELEGLLRDGGTGPGNASPEAIAELFDELVPARTVRESVYVVVESENRAGEFANARAGSTFVGREEGEGLLRGGAFEMALLHLPGGELDDGALSLVENLAKHCRKGKTGVVVLSGEAAGGLDFEGASAFVDRYVRGARLFGVAQPELTALYDLGGYDDDDVDLDADEAGLDEGEAYDRALERAERAWSDGSEDGPREAEEDDVPIDFDNRLGADPSMRDWVIVLGQADLAAGLTLIELPPRPVHDSARASDDDSASARAAATQVHEARRQADQAAIERQQLLEQLEDAHERIAALEESREPAPHGADNGARLDAALAAQQSLEWELTKLKSELEKERARPVGELEAELASLRAQLAERTAASSRPHTRAASPAAGPREARGVAPAQAVGPARAGPVLAELDRLLARVERGGIASMALHRSLAALRRRISLGR